MRVNIQMNKKDLTVISIFIFAFTCWLFAFPFFGPVMELFLTSIRAFSIEKGRIFLVFLLAMAGSSYLMGHVVDRTKRRLIFILIFALIGSVLTLTFLWLKTLGEAMLVSMFLGISAGAVAVSWGAYFADSTQPEERGKIMGIGMACAFIVAYFFWTVGDLGFGEMPSTPIIIISGIFLLMVLAFALRPPEKIRDIDPTKAGKQPVTKQTFYLYCISIFLFSWVGGIVFSVVLPTIRDLYGATNFYVIWAVLYSVGALTAGFFMDSEGRKPIAIVGLVIAGTSLVILWFGGMAMGYVGLIFMVFGFAFISVFSFVIWADLASALSRGRGYGIGHGILTLAFAMGLISIGITYGRVTIEEIRTSLLLASFLLFVCIVPLIFAEEPLPKELLEQRKLDEYTMMVKEMIKK